MLKKIIISNLIYMLFFISCGNTLSLDEAIKKSLLNYPGYKIRGYDVELGKINLKLSYSNFYPQVSTNVSGYENYDDLKGTNGSVTMDLNYNLFSGFSDAIDVMINRINLHLSKFIYEDYRRYVIMNVSNIYFNILKTSEILKSYKNLTESSKIALDIAKSRYEIGRIRQVEYLQAEVDYSRSMYEYETNLQALRNLFINLSTFTGESYNPDTKLETYFEDIKVNDVAFYLRKGFENNVNVVTSKYNVEVGSKEIKKSYSEFFPTIDLFAEKGRYYNEYSSPEYYTGSQVGVRATFNIFTGFSRYYNVVEGKTRYYQYLMREKEEINNMEEQIRTLYNNIISYNAQFLFLSNLLEQTKTNYQLTLESFALGKSSILELLDTRDRYEEAFMDYYNARFNIIRDFNELRYVSGLD
jgi:outer membrane protein